jgi:LPS O-antigen subunit length determinant protein (WzzB/FepE family)
MSEQSFNTISEDEISIKDIIDFLAESWKVIVLGGVAGGLMGLGYGLIAPAKYQATANIQVAKVAGTDVEAPALLVEKLKMPMYYSQKTYVACNVMDKLEPGEVIAKTLKPTLAKTAPIITISYREESREDAQKCLESVLDDVRSNQSLLAKPIFESKTNQLLNLKLKLESAEKIVKILPKNNAGFDFSDSKFSASTLLLATTLSKENEIKDLRTANNDLEIALLEPQTKEAFLTTPIYAPQKKVSPNRTMILVGGLVAGLFIGLLLMMVKRFYGAYKASNQQ